MTSKRLNKGAFICLAVCLICVGVLVASRMVEFIKRDDAQEVKSSPPIATYQAGVPFDLVGDAREVDSKGNEVWDPWDFSRGLDWTGTMRVTVSSPVLYDSPQDAGFAVAPDSADAPAGSHILAVDVALENVDAVCRKSVISENGAPSLNMMMFGMRTSAGGYCEALYFFAPEVDGITWDESKSMSYAWVDQGSTARLRIGYVVNLAGDSTSDARGSSRSDVELVAPDDDFQMVLDTGWTDGAPIVELGAATVSEVPHGAE